MGEGARAQQIHFLWIVAGLSLVVLLLTESLREAPRINPEANHDSGASGRILARPHVTELASLGGGEVHAEVSDAGGRARLPIADSGTLQIRVLAEASEEPVPSAVIIAKSLKTAPIFDGPVRKRVLLVADEQGRAELSCSILGRELEFSVQADGFLSENFFGFQSTTGVLTVRLKTAGALTGRVSPLEEDWVRLELYLGLEGGRFRIRDWRIQEKDDGVFHFDGLEAGTYTLVLLNKRGSQVKVWDVLLGRGEVITLDATVPAAGGVQVRTLERGSGTALPRQEWILTPEEGLGQPFKAKGNYEGLATFMDVPPGLWFLSTPWDRRSPPQVVRVRSNQTTQVVNDLTKPVRLELQLTGAGFDSQEEVRVTLVSLDPSTRRRKWRSRRKGDGKVVFRHLPANSPLLIEAVVASTEDGADSRPRLGARQCLELPAQLGPYVSSMQLLPTCEGEVRVRADSGLPLADVSVRLDESRWVRRRDWKPLSKSLDEGGAQIFRFTSFSGPCILEVSSSGYQAVRRRIHLAGEKQVVEVNLRPASQIECRFVHSSGSVMSRAMVLIERCELKSIEASQFTPLTAILGSTGGYTTRDLEPGSYDVTVLTPMGQQGTHRVEVGAGELRKIEFLQGDDDSIRVAREDSVIRRKRPTKMVR